MTDRDCSRCQEDIAEMALGILGGRERGAVLAHLQRCGRCQATAAGLAMTANRLSELAPRLEPPKGFDQRVVSAIIRQAGDSLNCDPLIPRPRTPGQRTPIIASVLAIVMLSLGAAYAVDSFSKPGVPQHPNEQDQSATDMMSAPLLAGSRQIGTVYLFAHRPVWVVVSMSGADDPSTATVDDTVRCDLTRRDGSQVALGSFALRDGHADWAVRTALDPDALTGAELTAHIGRVVSTASFTQPMTRSTISVTPTTRPPVVTITNAPTPTTKAVPSLSSKSPKTSPQSKPPSSPTRSKDFKDNGLDQAKIRLDTQLHPH